MAYIYCLTNNETNEKYIGQTRKSLKLRFKWHKSDSKSYLNKPHGIKKLYESMNQYGIESFSINLIEEVDEIYLDERERYWICKLDTVDNGLNASCGRGGNMECSDKEIEEMVEEYNNGELIVDIAKKHGRSKETVSKRLKEHTDTNPLRRRTKTIAMLTKAKEELKTFISTREAARYIISKQVTSSNESSICGKIVEAANGKRKTAYGYVWGYIA